MFTEKIYNKNDFTSTNANRLFQMNKKKNTQTQTDGQNCVLEWEKETEKNQRDRQVQRRDELLE